MRVQRFPSPAALILGVMVGCSDPSAPVPRAPGAARPVEAVTVSFPGENSGPPSFSMLEPLFVPHTDQWAPIVFLRNPACVPPSFNLLGQANPRDAFECALLVEGHATFRNGLPPVDLVPIHVTFKGLGAVAIWFISWPEFQVAMADGEVTIAELAALPSLRIGSASLFESTQHPGSERPQGFGNGKIEIVARGTLQGGGTFFFQVREMGIDQVSVLRHITVELTPTAHVELRVMLPRARTLP